MEMEIVFDNKVRRFRDMGTGKMVRLKWMRVDSLLHYSLIQSLDRRTAVLVREKLKAVRARGDGVDAMALRGKIAMAMNDLEEKLKGNGG